MRFYRISVDAGKYRRFTWAFPTYGVSGREVNCSVCNKKWRDTSAVYQDNIPYSITFVGNNFADLISCEGDKLVNKKIKSFFENNYGSFVEFIKMPVVKKRDFSEEMLKSFRRRLGYETKKLHDEAPEYYRIAVDIGACLHEKSNFEWVDSGLDRCKHCGYGVGYRLKDFFAPYYIDEKSWNGAPIFRVRELGYAIMCTEDIKTKCEENGFTGIEFDEVQAK